MANAAIAVYYLAAVDGGGDQGGGGVCVYGCSPKVSRQIFCLSTRLICASKSPSCTVPMRLHTSSFERYANN